MDIALPEKSLVPEGTRGVVFGGPAAGQPQYLPLPALVTPAGWVISEWHPTPGDLALLNAGAPLTLALRTGGGWPPTVLAAGGLDMRHYEDPPFTGIRCDAVPVSGDDNFNGYVSGKKHYVIKGREVSEEEFEAFVHPHELHRFEDEGGPAVD